MPGLEVVTAGDKNKGKMGLEPTASALGEPRATTGGEVH